MWISHLISVYLILHFVEKETKGIIFNLKTWPPPWFIYLPISVARITIKEHLSFPYWPVASDGARNLENPKCFYRNYLTASPFVIQNMLKTHTLQAITNSLFSDLYHDMLNWDCSRKFFLRIWRFLGEPYHCTQIYSTSMVSIWLQMSLILQFLFHYCLASCQFMSIQMPRWKCLTQKPWHLIRPAVNGRMELPHPGVPILKELPLLAFWLVSEAKWFQRFGSPLRHTEYDRVVYPPSSDPDCKDWKYTITSLHSILSIQSIEFQ